MPLGDIDWLFKQAERRKSMPRDLYLVRREPLLEFFGITAKTWNGWEKRGLVKPYRINTIKRLNLYDLNTLFDEERRLVFVPPTLAMLLNNVELENEHWLAFVKKLNPR